MQDKITAETRVGMASILFIASVSMAIGGLTAYIIVAPILFVIAVNIYAGLRVAFTGKSYSIRLP